MNNHKMFSKELAFLSNMYPCTIILPVLDVKYVFRSAEAAFQAGKCMERKDVAKIAGAPDGKTAKQLGRKVAINPDWETRRLAWMEIVVTAKFRQNPVLMEKLLATGTMELTETNTWHDTFWGVCDGVGENHLGKILMKVRERGNRIWQQKT